MSELELPDIKPRKGRKNRHMTRGNFRTFLALISEKKTFKKFRPFVEKIQSVLEQSGGTSEADLDLQCLSVDMKSLDSKLYKKLTDKIFDSDKKSEKNKSVKINRQLIETLQKIYPEYEVKEDLVNKALTDLIKYHRSSSATDKSTEKKSYPQLEKSNIRKEKHNKKNR